MKALILTGKYATDSEYIYALYRLQEADAEVDVAVPGKAIVFGAIGERITPTHDVSEVVAVDYDLLVLPGGAKAMEYLRQDKRVIEIIREVHASGKVIGSICHAAQLLISAGLVRGRNISGYYSIRDDIENAGGIYLDEPCVIFDRIVSSPHYKHLGHWMKGVLQTVALEAYWRDKHAGV